jgi:hypothetical protein
MHIEFHALLRFEDAMPSEFELTEPVPFMENPTEPRAAKIPDGKG